MADTKLSALTELAATPADTDEVYIRDVSEPAATESKRITVVNLLAGAGGGATLTVSETEVFNATSPTTWTDLDLSGTIGSNIALVLMKVVVGNAADVAFRKDGDTDEFYANSASAGGVALIASQGSTHAAILVATSSTGKIEWKTEFARASTVDIIAYIK